MLFAGLLNGNLVGIRFNEHLLLQFEAAPHLYREKRGVGVFGISLIYGDIFLGREVTWSKQVWGLFGPVLQTKDARHERPQNEQSPSQRRAVVEVEDAQFELPQVDPPYGQTQKPPRQERSASSNGFFRLSDRAFSHTRLQTLSGDCFRLFIWLSSRAWRYVKSDGTFRASVGYIERHTAMSHATVSRGLKTLREDDLIRLMEIDYKRGNVWWISPIVFAGCGPEDVPPRFEPPQDEGTQFDGSPPSKKARTTLKLRAEPPQIEGEIISIQKIQNLSQETAILYTRTEQNGAPEKRKSEQAALGELLKLYPASLLLQAVKHLDRNGVLRSGEKCHSPFRYLATAMEDVITVIRQKEAKGSAKVTLLTVQNASPKTDPVAERQQREAAMAAFQSELTDQEQQLATEKYVEREFTWGYIPSKSILTRLVAWQWFSERQAEQSVVAR